MKWKTCWAGLLSALTLVHCGSAIASPNIVGFLLDDAAAGDIDFMPRSTAYMRPNGVEFGNSYVTNSACAPSRATLLTGKYSHSHGGVANEFPLGGFLQFYQYGNESLSAAAWFSARGYHTAFVGKYLSGYDRNPLLPYNYIPFGWSDWYVILGDKFYYYGYTLNENGATRTYGFAPGDYMTDVLAQHAGRVVAKALDTGKPLFLVLAPTAPHNTVEAGAEDTYYLKATPAPRHATWFDGAAAVRSLSFNEPDVGDKPFKRRPLLDAEEIRVLDEQFRTRLQSLQSADEMVGSIIDQLGAASQLNNTYFILTSDNGWFYGDHRQAQGKRQLYEAASRVPLVIAGPKVVAGMRRPELVLNTDLFPTFADLADLDIPANVDGRSLKSLLMSRSRIVDGARKSFLLHVVRTDGTLYVGIRMPTYAYYEKYYPGSSFVPVELYDLEVDPNQARNLVGELTSESKERLHAALEGLRGCAGAACRLQEDTIDDNLVQFIGSQVSTRAGR